MTRTHRVIDSPIGPLTLVAEDGALAGLYMDGHRHRPADGTFGDAAPDQLDGVVRQLGEYFAGERQHFDVELAPVGTPWQHRVWEALRDIPYGTTRTYGQVAAALGVPGAARAVGLANGRNPVSIVVPCHRVVGADGSLTGYGGGVERKAHLLALERGLRAATA